MAYHRFKFEKMVRDKVVPQCIGEGCRPQTMTLNGSDKLDALLDKLREESQEVWDAKGDRTQTVKEMGDVMQVLHELMAATGITPEEVEAARKDKLQRKGGFSLGTYIVHNDLPDGHFELPDFFGQPAKYPYMGEVD